MKRNSSQSRRATQRGQSFVENALVLLVFLMTLIAAVDFSQVLFTHQMLVERVRSGLRWGMIHAWDGTGNGVANMILYNQSTPKTGSATFLGLRRENIQVIQTPGDVADPNDIRLQVSIVNYEFHFFTPFITKKFTNNRAVLESAPILYRN